MSLDRYNLLKAAYQSAAPSAGVVDEGCDGVACGSMIKKGSIPFNRLDQDDFINNLFLILGDPTNHDWFYEILNNFIREVLENEASEEWLKPIICKIVSTCDDTGIFELLPAQNIFPPQGGDKPLQVIVDDGEAWTLEIRS